MGGLRIAWMEVRHLVLNKHSRTSQIPRNQKTLRKEEAISAAGFPLPPRCVGQGCVGQVGLAPGGSPLDALGVCARVPGIWPCRSHVFRPGMGVLNHCSPRWRAALENKSSAWCRIDKRGSCVGSKAASASHAAPPSPLPPAGGWPAVPWAMAEGSGARPRRGPGRRSGAAAAGASTPPHRPSGTAPGGPSVAARGPGGPPSPHRVLGEGGGECSARVAATWRGGWHRLGRLTDPESTCQPCGECQGFF